MRSWRSPSWLRLDRPAGADSRGIADALHEHHPQRGGQRIVGTAKIAHARSHPVSLRRGVKLVLDRTSLTIQPGEKVGLVGRNGAGKSSLFSLLAGRLHADAGDVVAAAALAHRRGRAGDARDRPRARPTSSSPATPPWPRPRPSWRAPRRATTATRWPHAHDAISDAGGFDARPRAQAMLLGLGFKLAELDAPVSSFSGGWRMRLQLARALMCPADLMLLDEPTNHLDLDALVWLEAWLQRYAGTMIVISHDREFLDAVTKVTVHLDETKLARYTGNYTAFEEMRADPPRAGAGELREAEGAHGAPAEVHRPLQGQGEQGQAGAEPRQGAGADGKARAGADQRRLPVRVPRAAEPAEPDARVRRRRLRLSGRRPARRAKRIVDHIDRSVLAGQRIGILGANGQGKSTFVKTIAGDLAPLAGEIVAGKGLTIGYFAQQELDVLSPADGPLMHMVRLARDVGPAGARAGAARLPRLVPLHRRDGAAAGRHALGRREGAPRPRDAGLAAPQPAPPRRADQPPRPDDARGAQHGAQRVRGHGHAGEPRPRAAARGLRRVLARRAAAP